MTDVEKRIARNLFDDPTFSVFGNVPNWFRTLNYQAIYLISRSYSDILKEYVCVAIRIFCNVFFENTMLDFYNGPQHQFMEYRRCIFLQSKKFILQISVHINRKFLNLFQEDACPCVDYNCRFLKMLNKRYYQYFKSINKNEKVYHDSILNYFKDDWGQAFFEITSESS